MPDDCDMDLNTVGGLDWIDRAGRAARARLEQAAEDPVVGHGDWYTGNLRWERLQLHVAFDWDSAIAADEATVVGLAATVYPATTGGMEATVEETQGFLDAYCAARGRAFSREELERAWATGLWNRSFDAEKQFATEGQPRSLTEKESLERLRMAGVA
jgi:aminoglycoside phosphotransferase (APT) family kinase protein